MGALVSLATSAFFRSSSISSPSPSLCWTGFAAAFPQSGRRGDGRFVVDGGWPAQAFSCPSFLEFLRAGRLAYGGKAGSTSCTDRGVPPADDPSSTPRSCRLGQVTNAATPTGLSSLSVCAGDSAAALLLFVLNDGEVMDGGGNAADEAPRDVCVLSFFLGVFPVKEGQLDCLCMYPGFVEY